MRAEYVTHARSHCKNQLSVPSERSTVVPSARLQRRIPLTRGSWETWDLVQSDKRATKAAKYERLESDRGSYVQKCEAVEVNVLYKCHLSHPVRKSLVCWKYHELKET